MNLREPSRASSLPLIRISFTIRRRGLVQRRRRVRCSELPLLRKTGFPRRFTHLKHDRARPLGAPKLAAYQHAEQFAEDTDGGSSSPLVFSSGLGRRSDRAMKIANLVLWFLPGNLEVGWKKRGRPCSSTRLMYRVIRPDFCWRSLNRLLAFGFQRIV